jgi:hypothetical protein
LNDLLVIRSLRKKMQKPTLEGMLFLRFLSSHKPVSI